MWEWIKIFWDEGEESEAQRGTAGESDDRVEAGI